MNLVETIGAIAAGVITVAIVALVFQPNSTAPAVFKSGGDAFSGAIKAATLR